MNQQMNNNIPYCLPIHPKTLNFETKGSSVIPTTMTLDQLNALILKSPYLDQYPFIEIWLDYLEDDLPTALSQLCDHPLLSKKNIVFTLRTLNLSEPRLSVDARCEAVRLLNKLAYDKLNDNELGNLATEKSSANLILDLDIATQEPELLTFAAIRSSATPFNNQFLGHGSLSLITSYHDFNKTMDTVEFDQIITLMTAYNPQIFKIATYCNTPLDAAFLLQAGLRLRNQGHNAVTLGMGHHGLETRVFGTLWGNALCYCPIHNEARSAPGQYSVDQLRKVFKLLEEES